ncbi:HAD family acid phosphatase [Streptantibioticus parmotrematis]|uniref:HAD family acid phosphatase n=1 Tax=Streptantibioticus parmotrematis TaxID=2873249 RepID=UPI0033D25BE2
MRNAPASGSQNVTEQSWLSDVQKVANQAQSWLQQRLANVTPGERPAIVLDIDNTALATHFDPGKPVQAILRIAQYAEQHHAAVLFASYRQQDSYHSTLGQLQNAGYPVDGLCLRPDGSTEGKAQVKLDCRTNYEKKGYTLTANVGNQDTDFQGGHYEKAFKLPDYNGLLS